MLLDLRERERFAEYAKQEAESNALLAKQLRIRAMAWKVVADDLSKPVETLNIGG